jgi:hypothetical protein
LFVIVLQLDIQLSRREDLNPINRFNSATHLYLDLQRHKMCFPLNIEIPLTLKVSLASQSPKILGAINEYYRVVRKYQDFSN